MLSVSFLTATEAAQILEDFINLELQPTRPIPKIVVILGSMNKGQRMELVDRARVYVRTGSSRDLPPTSRAGDAIWLEGPRSAVDWPTLLRA